MRGSVLLVLAAFAVVALTTVAITFASWAAMVPGPAAAAPALSSSSVLQPQPIPQGSSVQPTGISVSGEGSITVKPDIARVTLGVAITNASAASAQQDAAAQMDAVMAELKKQGIEDKDIRTVRFDLSPQYDYSNRTQVLKGYQATNLVMVTLRDISKVGPVLDAVAAQGATRIQGISFSVSDPAAASQQGREEAMKDAQAKAQQLAKLAGVTLGRPISIEETVSAPPAPVEMAAAPSLAAPAAQTPISPGTQEIKTVVRVVYSIQ